MNAKQFQMAAAIAATRSLTLAEAKERLNRETRAAENRVLYFGCTIEPGHYLFNEAHKHLRYEDSPVPNLDGGYVPHAAKHGPEGVVRVTKLNGFTILGFRDNSIDTRGGSHSTFLVPGDLSYQEALDQAAAAFPFVFHRLQRRGITLTPEAT